MSNGKLSPTYYIRISINGKRRLKSTGCKTKEEARAWRDKYVYGAKKQVTAKALLENFRDELVGIDCINLDEAFEIFKKKPKKKPIGDRQMSHHKTRWGDFVEFMGHHHPGVKKLSSVTPKMAESYIIYLREKGRFTREIQYKRSSGRKIITSHLKTKLSTRGCNLYHQTCSQIFNTLFIDASLIVNPFEKVPKQTHIPEKREAFSLEELSAISEKAPEFIYSLFCIAFYTGMREGDICTLRWDEVNSGDGMIVRRLLKSRRAKTVRIPIIKPLETYLKKLKRLEDYVLPVHAELYQKDPGLITSRVKRFLKNMGIVTTVEAGEGMRKISIKDVHSLRHTFQYQCMINEIPGIIVKSIVGYSPKTVSDIYTDHVTDAEKKKFMKKYPEIF